MPKTASAKLPSRGQVMVKGTINDIAFQDALEPDGKGSHWLKIDTTMQKSAGAKPGTDAALVIESTKEWPEPKIPADLRAALDTNPQTAAVWEAVTPMARWEWIRWINSTKVPETRKRRIETTCSKLMSGLRRPCCFNRSVCCVADVSKNGVLLDA